MLSCNQIRWGVCPWANYWQLLFLKFAPTGLLKLVTFGAWLLLLDPKKLDQKGRHGVILWRIFSLKDVLPCASAEMSQLQETRTFCKSVSFWVFNKIFYFSRHFFQCLQTATALDACHHELWFSLLCRRSKVVFSIWGKILKPVFRGAEKRNIFFSGFEMNAILPDKTQYHCEITTVDPFAIY